MKLFNHSKTFMTFVVCTFMFTACEFLKTDDGGDDAPADQVTNTDAEGNVNGDPDFDPDDVIPAGCEGLGETEMTEAEKRDCVDQMQDIFDPGNLSATCQTKFDAAFSAAEKTLECGPDASGEPSEECKEAEMGMHDATANFYASCESEVGEGFVFPWNADHMDECPMDDKDCHHDPYMDSNYVNPEDMVSPECHNMDDPNMTQEEIDKCIAEYEEAFRPQGMDATCTAKYEDAFVAAQATVEAGCDDKGEQPPETDNCQALDDEMMDASDRFYTHCGGQVDAHFRFPWDMDHHDPNDYCDPAMGPCEDHYPECDPNMDDCYMTTK